MGCVVNLNKPPNIASRRAVSEVRKILKAKKAGHAGTLDPLAEGILLVCIDEATKISRFLSGLDKEYLATVRLGQATDTFDSEGSILSENDVSGITFADVESVIVKFDGDVMQVPPMFSAVKIKGKPLYKLARKGHVVERQPRKVHISGIDIIEFNNPILKLRIECSKGTYIRSIANDIGYLLGVGAHLSGLKRIRVGNFRIEDSVNMIPDDIKNNLIPMDSALSTMREMTLADEAASKLRNGVPVQCSGVTILNFEALDEREKSGLFRLKNKAGELFAIGKIIDGVVKTERVFIAKPKESF
jgi:tRNA pseudouridine55 synthase